MGVAGSTSSTGTIVSGRSSMVTWPAGMASRRRSRSRPEVPSGSECAWMVAQGARFPEASTRRETIPVTGAEAEAVTLGLAMAVVVAEAEAVGGAEGQGFTPRGTVERDIDRPGRCGRSLLDGRTSPLRFSTRRPREAATSLTGTTSGWPGSTCTQSKIQNSPKSKIGGPRPAGPDRPAPAPGPEGPRRAGPISPDLAARPAADDHTMPRAPIPRNLCQGAPAWNRRTPSPDARTGTVRNPLPAHH